MGDNVNILKEDQVLLNAIKNIDIGIESLCVIYGSLKGEAIRVEKCTEALRILSDGEHNNISYNSLSKLLNIPDAIKIGFISDFKNIGYMDAIKAILFSLNDEESKLNALKMIYDVKYGNLLYQIIDVLNPLEFKKSILSQYISKMSAIQIEDIIFDFDDNDKMDLLKNSKDLESEQMAIIIKTVKNEEYKDYLLEYYGPKLNLKAKAIIIMSYDNEKSNDLLKNGYKNIDSINLLGEELLPENIDKQVPEEYIKMLTILFTFKLSNILNFDLQHALVIDLGDHSVGARCHYPSKTIKFNKESLKYASCPDKKSKIDWFLRKMFHETAHMKQYSSSELPLYKNSLDYQTLTFVKDFILSEKISFYDLGNYYIKSVESDARAKSSVMTYEFISRFNKAFADEKQEEIKSDILKDESLLNSRLRLIGESMKKSHQGKFHIPDFLELLASTREKANLDAFFDSSFSKDDIKEMFDKYPILRIEYNVDGVMRSNEEILRYISRCDRILGMPDSNKVNKEKILKLKELYEKIIYYRNQKVDVLEQEFSERIWR